ncbi:MAG: hypothetical protein ACKVQS_02490 [Fimbriimonadaceae bacterium]
MTVLSFAFFASLVGHGEFSAESYALRWVPTQGETLTYTMHALSQDKENLMELEASLKQTITLKDDHGYLVETQNLGALMRVGGQDIRDNRGSKSEVVFTSRGAVATVKLGENDDEKNQWTFAVSRAFVAPEKSVAVGDGWQYEYKSKGAFEGARMTYSFESLKDGKAKVSFIMGGPGRERPQLGSGHWMIDAKSGLWDSMDGEFIDLFGAVGKVTLNLKRD